MTLAQLKKKLDDGELTQSEYKILVKEQKQKKFKKKSGYEPREDQIAVGGVKDRASSVGEKAPVGREAMKRERLTGETQSTPVRPNLLESIKKGFGDWLSPQFKKKKKKIEYKTPPD